MTLRWRLRRVVWSEQADVGAKGEPPAVSAASCSVKVPIFQEKPSPDDSSMAASRLVGPLRTPPRQRPELAVERARARPGALGRSRAAHQPQDPRGVRAAQHREQRRPPRRCTTARHLRVECGLADRQSQTRAERVENTRGHLPREGAPHSLACVPPILRGPARHVNCCI